MPMGFCPRVLGPQASEAGRGPHKREGAGLWEPQAGPNLPGPSWQAGRGLQVIPHSSLA